MSYTFSIPFQKPLVYHLICRCFCFFQCFLFFHFFLFSPWGPPRRVSTYCLFCFFGFSNVYFGFLHGALPKESQHIFFLCFSSLRPFPKDRWLPWQWMSWSGGQNLAFVFVTFSLTCILLWLYFNIHIAYLFMVFKDSLWQYVYISISRHYTLW